MFPITSSLVIFQRKLEKVSNICGGRERGAAKSHPRQAAKPCQMFQGKGAFGAGDSPPPASPQRRAFKAEARRAGRTGRGRAYLLPEVDGYVGDAEGHQEPDQGPVVRERREFHHSPRRGLTPHSSAAARALCWEARGARRGDGGRGRRGLGRRLLAATAPSPSAAALAGEPQAQVHPRCPPTQQRSAGDQERRDRDGGGGGGSRSFC